MPKRSGIFKRALHLAEYGALITASVILGILPERLVYKAAWLLGDIAFGVFKIRRDVTLENLERAFGDTCDRKEIERIARASYGNIAVTFIEMLVIPRLRKRIPDMVDLSGIDVLKRCVERGRGLILVSGHFGSWELNGASLGLAGIATTVVARRQSNPYVDEFVNKYRSSFRMKMITHGAPLKELIKALRNNEIIGLISDQDAGKRGVFVDFFGHKASTPTGAAQLALKYGAPIVVLMTKRTAPARYKTIFREIEILPGDTVEELTQRYTSVMEEIIRATPEQYFWMHKRWKTSPENQPGFSKRRSAPVAETEA